MTKFDKKNADVVSIGTKEHKLRDLFLSHYNATFYLTQTFLFNCLKSTSYAVVGGDNV